MKSTIRYFIKGIKNPAMNISLLVTKTDKINRVMSINLIVALLTSIFSLIHYFQGRQPSSIAFGGINESQYYLYQGIAFIPVLLLAWIMFSGVLYLLAISGKSASRRFFFDDALIITSLAWVLPWMFFVVLIQGVLYSITGVLLSQSLEIVRVIILPFIWSLIVLSIGSHTVYKTGWIKSILISAVSALCFYSVIYLFFR